MGYSFTFTLIDQIFCSHLRFHYLILHDDKLNLTKVPSYHTYSRQSAQAELWNTSISMSIKSKVRRAKKLQDLVKARLWPYHDYKNIQVATIYWQESANEGFERESSNFKAFCEKELEYPVKTIIIPECASPMGHQCFLNNKINSLLNKLKDQSGLLIIHYGGHGDPDDGKDQLQKSIWAS